MSAEGNAVSTAITVEQAAQRLQVTPNTIRTWIKQGRIPGNKIGRVYRIPEQALDQFTGGPSPVKPATRTALSLLGRYPRPGRTLDDIMREKHEETDEEERRWEEAHPALRKPEGEAA
jgi:excisionase family DNA binding protein